ncbi:MAG TPA: DUF4082 domain-containing protein, partial [Bacteroidia bacterium]|nr:DUF4082 domain-containing protein [Bacteroidia bacterium]
MKKNLYLITIKILTIYLFAFPGTVCKAQNAIVTENALSGTPSSQWDISGAGDLFIQGFATNISVNKSDTVHFKIKTNASAYTIQIYRIGYYQGNGARFIGTAAVTASLPQTQPADLYDVATGLTDCSNWSESGHWIVPANSVSGVYLALLTRSDNNGKSHILFIVRDDSGSSDLLFKTSDATWQAYNGYGGNSFYVDGNGIPGYNHATKISYNRPFLTRNGGGGSGSSEDWFFNAEYPMIRWLERNGYDVSYTTDVDMARMSGSITPSNHKVLLSVGHDEYWSEENRERFETAKENGVHLAFFSGNEIYWKTRWENDYHTLVCYKEGTLGENNCGGKCDPEAGQWTGLWRDGCSFPAANGCKPENALSGQISWGDGTASIVVPSEYKSLRFWRNTTIAGLANGNSVTLPNGTLGYEYDWEQYFSSYPSGRITLSNTNISGRTHKLSLYRHSSGALVFGAGTVQWSWGLDGTHDRGSSIVSQDMQQATKNLFADMGVQAGSPQSSPVLTAAFASSDFLSPVSVITNPANGDTLHENVSVVITGTASDAGGGVVAGVEVSVDNGQTWNLADGKNNWSYSWIPDTSGPATIFVRSFDDSGNQEESGPAPASNAINVNAIRGPAALCPCTLFSSSAVPAQIDEKDNSMGIELGMRFKSSDDGYITGIRFYKGALSTGTHTGNLWSNTGTLLASVNFSGETASGWQEMNLSTPVAITADTVYVVSCFSPTGYYPYTDPYFTTNINNGGPITGLSTTNAAGPNGIYSYATASSFPTQNYQSSNYWVDVVFNYSTGPDTIAPVVISKNPASNATGVNILSAIVIAFNETLDTSSVNSSTCQLLDGSNVPVSASLSYSQGTRTITLTPLTALRYNEQYTVILRGGATDPRLKDLAGNPVVPDYSFSFQTESPASQPAEGPGGPILVISAASNPFSRYIVEILRAQGFNEFNAMDISAVDQTVLNQYDVVILGEITLTSNTVTELTNWVNAGGTLIAFRPDSQLNTLLGITNAGGTLSDKYLLVNTATSPGVGIVNQTIQFHGTANQYALNGATGVATLYSTSSTPTSYLAITKNAVGSNGGSASAFAYDLSRSIVYTRQGNPAWSGQSRDGQAGPIRSDNLFFPDYVDFDKISIPQADEQQHLLSNLIVQGNLHRKPLPRFWFLPRKLKAAVIMTGDDHASGATVGRFNQYLGFGNNSVQDVLDWNAIRGTSYIYSSTDNTSTITNAQAAAFEAAGFEIALHVSTNCGNWSSQSDLDNNYYTPQLQQFSTKWPGVPAPSTNRTHCIAWSDWASQPKVEASKGIRLDANYYYWPASWVGDRPGMFTGSGMPMRFADLDGSLIDCYQVATQLTDESGITYSSHINALLDKAIGAEGYYGVFCANMHTDVNGGNSTFGSDAIIASALARQIPVISARQMLTWLDARNSSSFDSISWSGNTLNFSVMAASGSNKIQGMIPVISAVGQLTGITYNSSPISYTTEVIKGINYAFFDAHSGNYAATYLVDTTAPVITNIIATPQPNGTATITWTTNEAADSRVDYGMANNLLNLNNTDGALVTSHVITLNGLATGTTYFFRVTSADASSNHATAPDTSASALSFTIPGGPCVTDETAADFNAGIQSNTYVTSNPDGEVVLKPAVGSEFSVLPPVSEWKSFSWVAGGNATISSGSLSVNGARYNSDITQPLGPGASMEFSATFGAATFQHIGFGGGSDAIGTGGMYNGNDPWAMFSTNNSTSQLQARTFMGSAGITNVNVGSPGAYTGSSHIYRIQWNASSVDFYIDGTLMVSTATSITGTMRLGISDYNLSAPGVTVDWIHVSPYTSAGTFTSLVHDAGTQKNWGAASWTATVPAGTTLVLSQRQSNSGTAILNAAWTPIPANGSTIGGTSQYIQYKADFATTNTAFTPVLQNVSFACSVPTNAAPDVTTDPSSQSKCAGDTVTFASNASGNPAPAVQWQLSLNNGSSWNNIPFATNPVLTFVTTLADNGNHYRAIWTNAVSTDTSSAAVLTVNPLPSAALHPVANPICPGQSVALQLSNASGSSPFSIVMNGAAYSNINSGQTFANFNPAEFSIWGASGSPVNASVTDNQPIEIGTKFRSTLNGYITGIRFYKGVTNTGTHIANLWTSSGTLLATDTFTSESASGWQEVRFANPVAILSNTTYIASYFSVGGYFAISPGFFTSAGVNNGPLTALQSGIDGVNGVYKYGGGFPTAGNTANYWVDILFSQINPNALLNYELTTITDGNGCTLTGNPISNTLVTVSPSPSGSISSTTASVCNGNPIALTFNSSNGSSPFSLVINGVSYPNVVSGIPFTAGNGTYSSVPSTVWAPATIGGTQSVDNAPTELGVKIKSAIPGTITGIRFYKPGTDVLNFSASLWQVGNSTTPLATANYTSDNLPGWKQINFTTPVPIQANTSYIASYFSPGPNYYAYTANGLSAPVINNPLTAEASMYKQPGAGYPVSGSTANYWVDVVFSANLSSSVFNLTSITSGAGCTATGNPLSTATVAVTNSTADTSVTYITACDSFTWNGVLHT